VRCNLWSGWPTTARAGKCELLLSVLEHLCSGEKNSRDLYQYVLRWLAFPIQHTGAKMKTALVFHGPQRVGKNLFFESIMEIYGKYGRIVDQAAVEDKFNDWLSGKLFLIADEVVARNELYHLKNKLKGIVTGGWIRINPKNVAAHDERNHVNLVFLSNEYEPLVLEKDDGRYTVVWTPEKLDKDFYAEVKAEIDAGGIAALHQYLLDVDLGDFNEHTAPHMTTAKQDLIDIGLDSVERFTREWSAREIEFADGPLPFCAASSSDLYSAYKRWCGQSGIVRPREQSKFNGHFVKQRGWKIGHKDRYETLHYVGATLRQRMIIPSLEALTEAIRRPGGQDWRQEDAKTDAQWITDCFFAFRGALGAGQ
jgi:putative DNA primase/helicase